MQEPTDKVYAIVPAAGSGSRVGAAVPKQYLTIGPRTILEWSIRPLLEATWIDRIVVVVAPDDQVARGLLDRCDKVDVAPVGGATRRDTVLAGLARLANAVPVRDEDWVLVHDAARPGLDAHTLQRLRDTLRTDAIGGLLALPVSDTVKQADAGAMAGIGPRARLTLDRARLWTAQTPQMFRRGPLLAALRAHAEVTDEASALEREGHMPLLVTGSRDNFKVTTADDLRWMRWRLGEPSTGA